MSRLQDALDDVITRTHARARTHTAPLCFRRGGATVGTASGVLARLCGRSFVLTAGHVLADVGPGTSVHIGAPLSPEERERPAEVVLKVRLQSWGSLVLGAEADAGFLEISPADKDTAALLSRHSVTEPHIAVLEGGTDELGGALVTLSGHPSHLSPEARRILCYTTGAAGTGGAPALPRQLGPPSDQSLYVPLEAGAPELQGGLGGMSGGGYWRTAAHEGRLVVQLIGTHAHSTPCPLYVGGRPYRFASGTRVGSHLALIAMRHPTLRGPFQARWPALRL